jgi:hypothetical protein
MIMASFSNEIRVSKIKQPSLPISSIYASDKVIKVFHASCMRRSLMSVSLDVMVFIAFRYFGISKVGFDLNIM